MSTTIPPGGSVTYQSGLTGGLYSVKRQIALTPQGSDYVVAMQTYLQIDTAGTWQLKGYQILYTPPTPSPAFIVQTEETTPTPIDEALADVSIETPTPTPTPDDDALTPTPAE